jgi:tetratricopeptide (TPR) repeat protein
MGNYYYDQANWPQAVASYRAAIAGGLDNPNVRTDYGNALRFAGQPQKALEQYLKAQKQDPNHEQSLFNQGGLWAFSLGSKPKAVAAWRAYVKRFPQGQSVAQAQQFIAQNS